MLLRRLRDRVAGGRSLRCIATSATVGDDPHAVTEFAQRLFDADFEWVPGDPSRQDLVGATRRAMPEGPFWGPLAPASYLFIARSADPEAEVLRLAEAAGVAGYADAATALAHEHRIADLRALLAERPRPFTDLATELFDPGIDRNEALAALVTAGARVTTAQAQPSCRPATTCSPGPVRAHTRACPRPARTSPSPAGKRAATCSAASFEFGACKRCGAVYLSGSVRHTSDGLGLRSPAAAHRTPDLASRRGRAGRGGRGRRDPGGAGPDARHR